MTLTLGLGIAVAQEPADQAKNAAVSVSVADKVLYINGATAGTEIVIMNMLGDRVFQSTTKSDKETLDLNLRNGFYIVKVGTALKKIIIK